METALAVLLTLVIYIALPALVGFTIVGFFLLWWRRVRAKVGIAELVCSTNADCPSGYVCAGGCCIPAAQAQPA